MPTTLTPYLSFAGDTRDAFAFYARALGARIDTMMSYDDMPPMPAAEPGAEAATGCGGPAPTGPGIMHACLTLPGGAMLMAGDTPPGVPHPGNAGVMLALQFDSVDQAHRAFHALQADGGRVTMPLAPTFWARSFGMLTDRFGISWAVNGEPIPITAPAPETPMKTPLTFHVQIAAPRARVWQAMLSPDGYRTWTAAFCEGSTFDGSWEQGASIRFVGPDLSGMTAVIAENRPAEFLSIRHVGELQPGGVEDTTSAKVRAWAPAYETYTLVDADGGTHLTVTLESVPEHVSFMREAFPRALGLLKDLCERQSLPA